MDTKTFILPLVLLESMIKDRRGLFGPLDILLSLIWPRDNWYQKVVLSFSTDDDVKDIIEYTAFKLDQNSTWVFNYFYYLDTLIISITSINIQQKDTPILYWWHLNKLTRCSHWKQSESL